MRQVHAIVGRAQQVAKPFASFRIFVTALSTMQDAFPYSLKRVRKREREREREWERGGGWEGGRGREERGIAESDTIVHWVMEKKGIRKDWKY